MICPSLLNVVSQVMVIGDGVAPLVWLEHFFGFSLQGLSQLLQARIDDLPENATISSRILCRIVKNEVQHRLRGVEKLFLAGHYKGGPWFRLVVEQFANDLWIKCSRQFASPSTPDKFLHLVNVIGSQNLRRYGLWVRLVINLVNNLLRVSSSIHRISEL